MTDLQVAYFLSVAKHMSYTAAAKELFITQPSLSKQIAALERELNVMLFDRSRKNRLTLTPAGKLFQETFQRNRAAFQDTVRLVQLLQKNGAMELRIGIGSGWDWGEQLVRCGEFMREQWPEAKLLWQSQPFLNLRRMLDANELDVIFCTQTALDRFEELEVRTVMQAEATLYYSGVSSAAEHTDRLREEILYVLPSEEAPLSTEINRSYFSARQLAPKIEVLPNRESIFLALHSGGFAIMDNMMTARQNRAFRSVPLGLSIPICAAWKKRNQSPLIEPLVRWMEETLTGTYGIWGSGRE